jgi:hypothetical protein
LLKLLEFIGYAFWIGASQHSQAYILSMSTSEWGDIIIQAVILYNLIHKQIKDSAVTGDVQASQLVEDYDFMSARFIIEYKLIL